MVAIEFLKLHGECNQALQMVSTEKLETHAVIKMFLAATWHYVQNIGKKVQLRTESMQWAAQFFSIDTNVKEKKPQASTTRKEEVERRK